MRLVSGALDQCEGKVAFDTFSLANAVAKRKGAKADRIGPRHAYLCPHCSKWHIGAAKDREGRLRKRTD